jgi:L-ascorbate metabolism protein UlaG (beta-lactamase superfamily)
LLILTLIITVACAKEKTVKCSSAPAIKLGNDTTVTSANNIIVSAVTIADSGFWTILSGEGGLIESPGLESSNFSGTSNTDYLLKFDAFNACGKNSDTMSVSFKTEITPLAMINKMHWLGQSDYRIETAGKVIYIDHIKKTDDLPADIILITHSHGDHFSKDAIAKVATANTIILGPADCKYTGVCKEFITFLPGDEYAPDEYIKINAVPAYNIVKSNHPKSNKWLGYLVTSEGVTIYHSGDTERIPEMKEFTCDIALLPLGQTYTMASVDEAVEAAKDVKAKIAIPMHYGLYEGKVSDASDFKAKLDGIIEVVIKTIE